MRVLLLGNSNDAGEWFEGGRKRHEIVRDRLAELYGEPVEVITKPLWPNEDLPNVAEGWIRTYEPDVVYLTIVSFWFQYRSVPLRVRRLLGPFGNWVSDAGFRVAESSRWAYNPVFRGIRGALQSVIGGDPHFTTDEVVERVSDVIRRGLRHESTVFAVQGADGRTAYSKSRRGQARDEARRLLVDQRMRTFCAEHHVFYENPHIPVWATDPALAKNRVGDGLHANAQWHERSAELIVGTIKQALDAEGRAAPERVPEGEGVAD